MKFKRALSTKRPLAGQPRPALGRGGPRGRPRGGRPPPRSRPVPRSARAIEGGPAQTPIGIGSGFNDCITENKDCRLAPAPDPAGTRPGRRGLLARRSRRGADLAQAGRKAARGTRDPRDPSKVGRERSCPCARSYTRSYFVNNRSLLLGNSRASPIPGSSRCGLQDSRTPAAQGCSRLSAAALPGFAAAAARCGALQSRLQPGCAPRGPRTVAAPPCSALLRTGNAKGS